MVKELVIGFKNFRATYFQNNSQIFQKLAKDGQSPKTMVICCSDSRVEPSILFGTGPGDLFIVRNVANLVPPFASKNSVSTGAALEYAVKSLRVKDIIVLGHAHCGGVAALCKKINNKKALEIHAWWLDFESVTLWKKAQESDAFTPMEF